MISCRHYLERYGRESVYFCDDLAVALELNQQWITDGPVVTALTTGRTGIATTDLQGLKNKDVIYIPTASRKSFFQFHKLIEQTKNIGLASLRICCAPVLLEAIPSFLRAIIDELKDPWERFVLGNAWGIDALRPSGLQLFDNESKRLKEYETWGREVGLLRPSAEVKADKREDSLVLHTPAQQTASTHFDSSAKLDAFCWPNSVGVIIAPPNIGKTLLAISIAVARSSGKPLLEFPAVPRENVLYLDGEAGSEHLGKLFVVARKSLGLGEGVALEGVNYICTQAGDSLSSDEFQLKVEAAITENKVNLLIVDNLIALCPGFRQSGGAQWTKVWQWFQRLGSKYDAAVLVIHHDNEEGEPAGSKDIKAQCQSVVCLHALRGNKLGTEQKEISSTLLQAEQDGALFQVEFAKCKRYPQLENKSFVAFLPLHTEEATSPPRWERIEIDGGVSENSLESKLQDGIIHLNERFPGRTDDEYTVLAHIDSKGGVSRKDIENLLKVRQTAAGNVLRQLVEDNILDKIGQSRATLYRLRK